MNNRWLDKEKLLRELDELADQQNYGSIYGKLAKLYKSIESGTFDAPEANQLLEENAKLVSALEWYGEDKNYKLGNQTILGQRARDVMSELRGGESK